MKNSILTVIFTLIFVSNFSFAEEIGENQKPNCIYAEQSAKREPKATSPSEDPSAEKPIEKPTSINK